MNEQIARQPQQQQLLTTTVLMGINRLVVDDGRISHSYKVPGVYVPEIPPGINE